MKKMKKKMKKFKFYPQDIYSIDEMKEDFQIVECPLLYNLKKYPSGVYTIRGDKRNHRKTYWVVENIWFLVSSEEKDNGRSYCDYATYRLFPVLPHREYLKLRTVQERLSPLWKKNTSGYFFWLQLREIERSVKF